MSHQQVYRFIDLWQLAINPSTLNLIDTSNIKVSNLKSGSLI